MTKQYVHRVTAWWTSGCGGIVTSDSSPSAIHFTAPPEFKGLEGMWTPEDLMLSALASCFVTTFHCLATYASFEYQDLQVEAEGKFGKADSGYKFKQVLLRPTLRVPSAKQEESALKLLENTKMLCLVSRAISTPLIFEPRVEVESSRECAMVAENAVDSQ
jgi:organic hydroperoxide reductase OsmC/OhrA